MIKENINIKKTIVIIIVSSLLGIAYNYFSNSGIDFIRTETTFEQADDDELNTLHTINNSETQTITLTQAHTLFEANRAIFIDARDKWDFAEGHITGAVNIPLYNFDPQSEIFINLDKSLIYVIYCNDDDCETSQRLALEFSNLSFTHLYIFEEGWSAWQNAQYPTETSEIK